MLYSCFTHALLAEHQHKLPIGDLDKVLLLALLMLYSCFTRALLAGHQHKLPIGDLDKVLVP